jgi:hypothetical protein
MFMMYPYSPQSRKSILVRIELDGCRRASKNALSTGVLSRRQAIDDIAGVIVDIPASDLIVEFLLIANAVVEPGANGGGEACCEGREDEGGETHVEKLVEFEQYYV